MKIDLSDREVKLLTRILDQYYRTLREEIYKTETYQVKDQLKDEESLVEGLLERLRGLKGEKAPEAGAD